MNAESKQFMVREKITRYQWIVLLVAWLGWVFDIMDTALFNFAKVPMLTDMLGGEANYKLHGAAIEGKIQMIFIIGWAIGGLFFGMLADKWGRTKTMVLTILLYCSLTGLTALCQTWEQVAVVRFLTALGIGGEWAAGAALVAEVFSTGRRPLAAAFLQTAAAVGPILAATLNLGLAAQSWRWLFVVGILPAVITLFIRRAVKEPEKWTEAKAAAPQSNPVIALFTHPKWARHAIIAMIIGTVGIAGAGNVAFWLPNLVKAASEGMEPALVQARMSYATYMLHTGTILGVFAFPWLAARLGRRTSLAIAFVLAPISIWYALYGGGSYERLMALAPLLSFFAIGCSAVFGLYFPELFPTRIRATGAGFAYNTARILQAPVPAITGSLINSPAGTTAHGVTLAALVYVIGLIALPFAPETKDKPLPED